MLKLKIIAAVLAIAGGTAISLPAHAHGYPHGPPIDPYSPAWRYGVAMAYGYYDREYRRAERGAERQFRRGLKREARAYRKMRRAYSRNALRYGYPYGVEFGGYW